MKYQPTNRTRVHLLGPLTRSVVRRTYCEISVSPSTNLTTELGEVTCQICQFKAAK